MRADQINPADYQSLLDQKVTETTALFSQFVHPEITVFPSKPENYRLRCEFRVWHEGDDFDYIMFDPATKERIKLESFIPAAELINQLMPRLKTLLKQTELTKRKLYQIDFLTTLSNQVLITLIYHKPLDEHWQQEILKVRELLRADIPQLNIIGRSRKQKMLLDQDFVTETLTVHGEQYQYQQIENSFTQPNGEMNQIMLEWARDQADGIGGDFIELYCGNGNFSIPLSKKFNKVLATEIAKSSVNSAKYNFELNQVTNIDVARISSEELSEALNTGGTHKQLKNIDLADYQFSTILVDPPRAGLDDQTIELVKKHDNIIYISCNPETLAENLSDICQTHEIVNFAFFDQFPYTHHIESGVFLTRKK